MALSIDKYVRSDTQSQLLDSVTPAASTDRALKPLVSWFRGGAAIFATALLRHGGQLRHFGLENTAK
jgi:hypothetical protein